MEIGEFSSFNPMEEFNKMSAKNGMEIGKFNNGTLLEGHVSIDAPKISDMKMDTETLNDLNALNINPTEKVSQPNTADGFYKSLSNAIGDGIQNVNDMQRSAEAAQEYFASGGDIDVHSVMIASQKAYMGLEMATQLRNKVISAYKEITRMSF
ncbi:MAG: flagellar hook-basal body complex protein FliE [Candidatus Gastranaerophilales bacterium]|nr:flagellar hook-basal body complex protein FliE [Candidatus Gastranaerophilales bacterium]